MNDYVLVAACILLAGFHSGSEMGLYCVNRLRLRLRAEQGQAAARALQRLVGRPRLAISTVLVGTNLGVYLATTPTA
jgi:Mg2+/Co2+ transporter CorB